MSLRATRILNNPNTPMKTLVSLIDLIFFKFLVKISVNIDDPVSKQVSAVEIIAESKPKYKRRLIGFGKVLAATCSNGD